MFSKLKQLTNNFLLMLAKITQNFLETAGLKIALMIVLFLSSSLLFGQTVTSISPTIVTKGSIVTVIGFDFTTSTDNTFNTLDINNGNIDITNMKFVDSETMTFEINSNSTSDIKGNLFVDGADTGFEIKYLAPINKSIGNSINNLNGRITEIFTDWRRGQTEFWKSSDWVNGNTNTWPNDHNNLTAFTYDGTTYSTGVADDSLTANGVTFIPQNFKAYSSDGVQGVTNNAHYLIYADNIDGNPSNNESATITSPNITGATIFNSIIDGINGLDLGTGITNFNNDVSVRFFSGNGQVGAVTDDIPDLLITQIADADDNTADIYYYADVLGNVVGRPIKLNIKKDNNYLGDGLLAKWRTDLFRFDNGDTFDVATPSSFSTSQSVYKTLKMVALKLQEFNITATNLDSIKNVNMAAGGSADIAFLAYNKNAFDIKAPNVVRYPVSQFICKFPNTSGIQFNAIAQIDGGATENPVPEDEQLNYKWFKYNSPAPGSTPGFMPDNAVGAPYSLTGGITPGELGTYNLEISNKYGTIRLPVTISEGGTPTFWNGSNWVLPNVYSAANVIPNDSDRNLIFREDYNENTDLEGCNCKVPAGSNVLIPEGKTVKLYSEITVEPEVDVLDADTGMVVSTIPAGTFILEDNASLIQTKSVSASEVENFGHIIMKRDATTTNNNDYVYWSSPVKEGNLTMVTGSSNHAYRWEVNTPNTGFGVGNWGSVPEGIMDIGRGYIKRISSSGTSTTNFEGTPNNGLINTPIYLTGSGGNTGITEADKHWNLVGNPYPSAISAEKFLIINASDIENDPSIDGGVYLWTHGTPASSASGQPFYDNFPQNYDVSNYLVFNATAPTDPEFDGFIGAGQGFFVKAKTSGSGSVRFENNMRFKDGEANYNNTQFFRNADGEEGESSNLTDSEKQLIWLALTNEASVSTVAVVGYVAGATNNEDNLYDSQSMGSDDFSLFSNVSNKKMVIQGRPLPFTEADLVNLGFAIPSNGIYNIGIDHLKGSVFLNGEQGIYLEDTYLNVIHDLRLAPYTFTGEAGTANDRFVLRYTTDETLAVNEAISSETFAFIKNSELQVRSSQGIEAIQIYDLNGKQIANYLTQGSNTSFNASFQFARGVYLAVITLDNDLVVKKKLLN